MEEVLVKKTRLIMDLSLRVSLLSQENERLKRIGGKGENTSQALCDDLSTIACAAEF
jgi:hypothetical protein